MEFSGRTAVITGGAMGNGLGIARVLLSKGCSLAIFDKSDAVFETAEQMIKEGHDVLAMQVDVSDEAAVKAAVKKTIDHFGKIDILINNAGIMDAYGILEAPAGNLDKHMDVNVRGPWNMVRAVAPYMKEQHYGRIITVASVTGAFVSDGNDAAYAVSKAALTGFGRSVASAFIRDGITSNVICPGYIHTPMVDKYAAELNPEHPEEELERISRSLPIGHMGEPEDIGYLAAYLASEHAGFMTGSIIVIDGGCILPETARGIF